MSWVLASLSGSVRASVRNISSDAAARASIESALSSRAAAARGARPFEAAALEASRKPQRILLDTAIGLEASLERELELLRIPGTRWRYRGGVGVEGPEAVLWRIAMESRLVESIRLGVKMPFHSAYESTLRNHSAGVQWTDYMWFTPKTVNPQIRINVEESRLFHTEVIKSSVTTAIEDQRQKYLKQKLQTASDEEFYNDDPLPEPPTVHVSLRKDECELSVSATAALHQRAYFSACDAPDEAEGEYFLDGEPSIKTTPLGDAHAAACVLKAFLPKYLQEATAQGNRLTVWDPFCGQGTMLLEALGILLGVPPSSPFAHLPFKHWPSFNEMRFNEVVRKIKMQPQRSNLNNLTLLGTCRDPELAGIAQSHLTGFLKALPQPKDASVVSQVDLHDRVPCAVEFRAIPSLLEKQPEMAHGHDIVILTNIPYGMKAIASNMGKQYEQFGLMVRRLAVEGRLKAVYCLSAREEFKRRSGLDWRTELRFSNGGISVDLLRWTGRRAQGRNDQDTGEKEKPRKRRPEKKRRKGVEE